METSLTPIMKGISADMLWLQPRRLAGGVPISQALGQGTPLGKRDPDLNWQRCGGFALVRVSCLLLGNSPQ